MSRNERQQEAEENARSLSISFTEYLPADGLPPFCIEDIFPNSRSVSPIELDRMSTEATCGESEELSSNDEEMTIEDLNYAISACVTPPMPPRGLDTIFEGVSLATQPSVIGPVNFNPNSMYKTDTTESFSHSRLMQQDLYLSGSSRHPDVHSYDQNAFVVPNSNTVSPITNNGAIENHSDNLTISYEIQMVVDRTDQINDTSDESDLQLRIARCNVNDSLSNI